MGLKADELQSHEITKGESGLIGGCRCGAVQYEVSVTTLPPIYCCHCLLCQSSSGSAFSEQAIVAATAIKASGPILDYRFERPGGGEAHHRLCARCHTRLWSTNDVYPDYAFIRAGTLERSQELVPRAHMWVKRKQAWVRLDSSVPQWPESPPVHPGSTGRSGG